MKLAPPLALGVLLGLSGCAKQAVEGSLTESLNLEFDKAELIVNRNGDGSFFDVSVRFVKLLGDAGASEDVVLKVGAHSTSKNPLMLAPQVPVDLAEYLSDGKQRGVVSRSTYEDPNHVFPALDRGSLTLDKLPEDPPVSGQKIPGSFSITFELGTRAENGRTAFKTFEAFVP